MEKFLFQDSEDSISHLEWETVRVKFMKAGTLEKLVESLTSDDGELESTYINIFFATYRTFATPEKVLSLILERLVRLSLCHCKNFFFASYRLSSDINTRISNCLVEY